MTENKRHFTLKLPPGRTDGDSIIVPFDSKWDDALRNNGFSIVYRKIHSFELQIRWIYAYLTQPISAIAAKMPVNKVQRMPLDDAVKLSDRSMHTEDEIRKYAKGFRNFKELVVYDVGPIQYARKPIEFSHLERHYDFWPASTYIPLSPEGSKVLDELAGF